MLIFVDVETGGLDPQVHSLLEVGLVAYENGDVWHEDKFYIKHDEYVVTADALRVNGLDLRAIHEAGITKETAVRRIENLVRFIKPSEPPVLVGHNVDFDRRFLMALFAGEGKSLDDVINHRTMDTAGTIRFLKEAGLLPHDFPGSLHKAARALGYEPQGEHTAMGDIRTTIFVFEQLMKIVKGGK
jgi:DNA polymerase III epsilon subunit-like protein